MRLFDSVPRRFLLLLKTFVFFATLLTLLRIIFFLVFHDVLFELPGGLTFQAFWLGFRFDLRLTVILWLPFLLLSWVPFLNLTKQKPFTLLIWRIYWLFILTVVLIAYAVDLGYFAYVKTRLDASILGMARDFKISMNMIWETYPVIPGFGAIIMLIWGLNHLLRVKILNTDTEKSPPWPLAYRSILYVLSFIFALGIGYGKWSRYPLRWSDAYFTPNENASQLAINPILLLGNTYSRRGENWDLGKVKKYHAEFAQYFDFEITDTLNFARYTSPSNSLGDSPNIVIFILETFPTFKTGAYGNQLEASPFFDKIAPQSIHFRNFYVPKFSTAASIFCSMSGLPDVSTINKSSTRDPGAIHQHLLMNDLKTYQKHFFIGGSANWGDIGGFFKNNVEGITIHEEGDYEVEEVNAWGISDYHLLQAIHQTLSTETAPFISVALTAGHHPPYSIPEDTDFESRKLGSKLAGSGFLHDQEYNSFRFMDYALEAFFKSAETSSYYQNTLFVILGDHGFGDSSIPAHQGNLSLQYHHVPLLIYAPGLNISPQEIYKTVSEIDLMPTLLSLVGQPYINTTLGKDALSIPDSVSHYAFTFNASSASYGLVSDKYYVVKNSYGPIDVYEHDSDQKIDEWNDEVTYMSRLSDAYYELSKYLRYNNKEDQTL